MPLVRAALIGLVLVLGALLLRPLQRILLWGGWPADWPVIMFSRLLLLLIGVRIEHESRPAPSGARLIVANHVSWLDILALASIEPLCFLAKHDVADWPLIGGVAAAHGTVFIDRRRPRRILGANAAMAERLAAGRSVVLFAEGTTNDGRRRGPFLTSHLACLRDRHGRGGGPVMAQAVALGYSDPVAAWIGEATLLPHAWALLNRPGVTCRVSFGAPLPVEPGFDRKDLGRTLAATVEGLLAGDGAGRLHAVDYDRNMLAGDAPRRHRGELA